MLQTYFLMCLLSRFVFGFTDTTVSLQTMKAVEPWLYTMANIVTPFAVFSINSVMANIDRKNKLWEMKGRILLADIAVVLILCLISTISLNMRYFLIATISTISNEFILLLWEMVKEKKGNGAELHTSLESKSFLGYGLGALTWLVVSSFGFSLSLTNGLILHFAILAAETFALWLVIRKIA